MKSLPSLLLFIVLGTVSSYRDRKFKEDLYIIHLPDSRTMADFEFSIVWHIHPLNFAQESKVRHYGMFPKSLAEVISHYKVQELHLTLTQGKWRTRVWGYPPLSSPPGAELWAWFLPQASAELEWAGLVNAMSGLLCAHLNAIGPKATYQPLYSFKPQGAVLGNVSSSQMRYGALPRETVCTENFTPWTKLLPCGTSAGLGSLFSALILYDTDYHSLGLHFQPVCQDDDCSQMGIELRQTLTVVFPPSIKKGLIDWSLGALFGNVIKSQCPMAISRVLVAETCPATGLKFVADPPPQRAGGWMIYDISNVTGKMSKFNFFIKSESQVFKGMPYPPELHVQRFLSGSSHGWGGLHTEISNSHSSKNLRLIYLDMIPWFCRIFIHTLHISNGVILHQHYKPAKDRQRPHMIELLLEVPPETTAVITVQFSRAFLKWTEHPPDAHHGFYINSAVISTVISDCINCSLSRSGTNSFSNETILRLHTEALLISLPTPDFSMPYNVICFVCTVIAIGFGSIFNLATRKLEPATPEKSKGLLKRILTCIRSRLRKQSEDEKTSDLTDGNNE